MNESAADKLHSILFDEGRELVNIKFFPGTDRGLTATQLKEAAAGAIASALKKGPVHNPPVTGRKKMKLEEV